MPRVASGPHPVTNSIGAPSKWALSTPVSALAWATPLLTAQTPTRPDRRPAHSAI